MSFFHKYDTQKIDLHKQSPGKKQTNKASIAKLSSSCAKLSFLLFNGKQHTRQKFMAIFAAIRRNSPGLLLLLRATDQHRVHVRASESNFANTRPQVHAMEQRKLGTTALTVSSIGMGEEVAAELSAESAPAG